MAVVPANILGVTFLSEFAGPGNGGTAIVSFDLFGSAATAGDTVKLGGGGWDDGVATTSTLAAIIQTRRRDGKTVTLTGAAGTVAPAVQSGTTSYWAWAAAVSAGNIQSIQMGSTAASSTAAAIAAAAFDQPCVLAFTYVAV